MAVRATFLDTSGFYSVFVPQDPKHERAKAILADPERRFVSSDWVCGETVNLLVARRRPHLAVRFLRDFCGGFEMVHGSESLFRRATELFSTYADQAFPFTDCTTFVLMRELGITDALTADGHFRIMGFDPLLAG